MEPLTLGLLITAGLLYYSLGFVCTFVYERQTREENFGLYVASAIGLGFIPILNSLNQIMLKKKYRLEEDKNAIALSNILNYSNVEISKRNYKPMIMLGPSEVIITEKDNKATVEVNGLTFTVSSNNQYITKLKEKVILELATINKLES